ncbi:hypothetical protein SLS60_008157 [Paraconiothyrium brasiliense]|uniref:Heterokaryon incompatibility domain-containing protein n=1 Tax=Paraconiothyrium brasiliense TaxID=300254 RepID=A0ABR3R3N2_9PLEO
MERTGHSTTFDYAPIPEIDHLRLLQIRLLNDEQKEKSCAYTIVNTELSPNAGLETDFEAVSYTWGSPHRVSSLPLSGCAGSIGLTQNLTQALPHLSRHSTTKHLWIDQICINQDDPIEKSHQIGMMSRIYKSSKKVLVWLGPEDESSRLCKQWLHAVADMIKGMPRSDRMTPGTETFNPNIRFLVVKSTFVSPGNDPMYAPAIRTFWSRPWFTRGWVVQELLLAPNVLFVVGELHFSLQDLADLQSVPSNQAIDKTDQQYISANILMNLRFQPFTEQQPLRFLRLMAQAAQEFQTSKVEDRLYAFLGMCEGSGFTPDYCKSIEENFTEFAATLARMFGSLDFLSLWSANLDSLLPRKPGEPESLPSWVPSWSGVPLAAPFRFAAGGVRTIGTNVSWNAANGRTHHHHQPEDVTRRLYVRGKIIDHIDAVSSARFARPWEVDDVHLDNLVETIKHDLPGSGFDDWTRIDLISFLSIVASNGDEPRESPEEVLGVMPKVWGNELSNMSGYNESLGTCIAIGIGRRVMKTEKGRIGLAPWIGSKKGCVIVILHGCVVPIVLEAVDGEDVEYKVIGDCYVKGIMHGEGVSWTEEEAETFILI